jgi:hypothetical protein
MPLRRGNPRYLGTTVPLVLLLALARDEAASSKIAGSITARCMYKGVLLRAGDGRKQTACGLQNPVLASDMAIAKTNGWSACRCATQLHNGLTSTAEAPDQHR